MAGNPEEKLLIERAKNGDSDSFEQLIENCKTRAYNIALRYLRNEEDAMDALQESFIKIFKYLGKFKGDCSFDTWVYRIVVNTCNDLLRKNIHAKETDSIYKSGEDGESTMEIRDRAPLPEDELERKEKAQLILACMEKLSDDQREVILLRDVQGFSYEEIGTMLECSIGTVKSRINRSRGRLREILMEQMKKDCV